MRFTLLVLLAGCCVGNFASPFEEEISDLNQLDYHTYTLADKTYLKQYKDVLSLFKYVHQSTYSQYHADTAKQYSVEQELSDCTSPDAVDEFLRHYRHGLLPKDEIFSVFYDTHLKQAIALFKILFFAKDFDTFYRTAVWARYNLNQGLFLYAYSVALIHRPDTYSMILPPIYEVYPYYFFNSEVIQKIQDLKQSHVAGSEKEYRVYANYSGWYLNLHPEQSLSYFTEDIGVNSYYYYYNLYRPFWMKNEHYNIHSYYRGEEFYYFCQQYVARYYLERLSNDFGEIGSYDYHTAFETGYYPSLRYPNGLEFPTRSNWVYFFTNYYNHGQSYSFKGKYPYSYYKVVDYERRIRDAIDIGYVYTEDGSKISLLQPSGFNVLGNIIESNSYSPNTRFYGYLQTFARHLLGYSYQPLNEHKAIPSALEHFETSLRDPAFWQLYKRLVLYFQKFKHHLPRYSHDDLAYPGVKIESVNVDRLVTYFEDYDVDLTNAVYVNADEFEQSPFKVYARQSRLNHKPVTYRIKVSSEKAAKAVIRIFIGPKYDEYGRLINVDENRINFVEIGRFIHELKSGRNVIERNCKQTYYSSDRTSYRKLYQYVLTGVNTGEQFSTHGSEVYYAFPNRFLLPKGKPGGQTYQLFVIVSPYTPPKLLHTKQKDRHQHKHIYEKLHDGEEYQYFKYPMVGLGVQYLDNYPLGYPFDKPIDEHIFTVPNLYFQDVVIYHYKDIEDSNKSNYPAKGTKRV